MVAEVIRAGNRHGGGDGGGGSQGLGHSARIAYFLNLEDSCGQGRRRSWATANFRKHRSNLRYRTLQRRVSTRKNAPTSSHRTLSSEIRIFATFFESEIQKGGGHLATVARFSGKFEKYYFLFICFVSFACGRKTPSEQQ